MNCDCKLLQRLTVAERAPLYTQRKATDQSPAHDDEVIEKSATMPLTFHLILLRQMGRKLYANTGLYTVYNNK